MYMGKVGKLCKQSWCIFSNQIYHKTTCFSNTPTSPFHASSFTSSPPKATTVLVSTVSCPFYLPLKVKRSPTHSMCLLLFLHITLVRFPLFFCMPSWSVTEWMNSNECLPRQAFAHFGRTEGAWTDLDFWKSERAPSEITRRKQHCRSRLWPPRLVHQRHISSRL